MQETTKSKIRGILGIFFFVYIFAWGISGCDAGKAQAEEVKKINLSGKTFKLDKDIADGYPKFKFCCNFDDDRLTPDYAFKTITANDGPVRLGNNSIKFELRVGDCGTSPGGYDDCSYNSERHELNNIDGHELRGVTWHTASFFLDKDLPIHKNGASFFNHMSILQFHSDGDGAPGWNFSVDTNGLELQRRTACNLSRNQYKKLVGKKKPKRCSVSNKGNNYEVVIRPNDLLGQWVDVVFNVKWTTKQTGYMKMWINGKLVYHYIGSTKTPGEREGFQFGLYREVNNNTPNEATSIAYFDELRLAKKHCKKLNLEDLGYSCIELENQSIRKIDKIK